MQKKDCFYLGKIVKKYSFKGEVILKLDTDSPEIYQDLEFVYVEKGNQLLPFFIESCSAPKADLLRVQFEDVYSEEAADVIVKCAVYLPLKFLPKLEKDQFYYHEIIGTVLHDERFGEVGVILGIDDSTPQPLFIVDHRGTEILIPMIDEFMVKIDKANKTVLVNTPEGLIEMNLPE
ncbi:MAG: ribosome maturation factor RimM [Lutimonas sp.]